MKKLSKKGLTIVELVISIALISLIMLFMYQLLGDITFDKENDYFAVNDQNQRMEIVRKIKDEIGVNTVKEAIKINNTTIRVTDVANRIFFIVASGNNITIYINSIVGANIRRSWTYGQGFFGEVNCSVPVNCIDSDSLPCGKIYQCHIPVYTKNYDNTNYLNNNNIIDDIFLDFVDVPSLIYSQNTFLNDKVKRLSTYPKLESTSARSLYALLNSQPKLSGFTSIRTVDLNHFNLDYQVNEPNFVYFADAPGEDVVVAWRSGTSVMLGERGGVKVGPSFVSAFKEGIDLYEIELSQLDTSYVTSMQGAFENAGSNVTGAFSLILGNNFITSQITNMRGMFRNVGQNATTFNFGKQSSADISAQIMRTNFGQGFNTSKVTDGAFMFSNFGRSSVTRNFIFELPGSFNTSNMTNLAYMFHYTGFSHNNLVFNLSSEFNTSKATNMQGMFYATGYNKNTFFTINLGKKFNTSNVTNMYAMFTSAGYNSTVFTLDLGDKFNTAKVANMHSMFKSTGANAGVFNANLSGFKVNNTSVDLTNFAYYSGITNLTLGPGWTAANMSQISFTRPRLININGSSSCIEFRNASRWTTWRGSGNYNIQS